MNPLIVDIRIPYGIRENLRQGSPCLVGSNEEKNAYLAAVKNELLSYEGSLEDYEVHALRLSGGSATVMSPDLLGDLLKTAREVLPVARGAEVSVDAHPLTIGTPSLTGIASGHPNRMELQMLSGNHDELKTLGCGFTMQHVNNALLFFRRFHMNNYGLTVTLGIPGQTMQSWMNTLHACTIIHPPHITVSRMAAGGEILQNQEELFSLYAAACDYLAENGYLQYSSGCFCLPQHASQYEINRLDGGSFLGMGLGASTLLDGYLTRSTGNLSIYLQHAGNFEKTTAQVFSADENWLIGRYISLRLRSTNGLDPEQFRQKFRCEIPEAKKTELLGQAEAGLLEEKSGRFLPTKRGLFNTLSE